MPQLDKLPDLLFNMMQNKEEVVKRLLKDITVCQANMDTFDKLFAKQKAGDKLDIDKVHAAYSAAIKQQYAILLRVVTLSLVYSSGGNYDSDLALVLAKLGQGDAALKQMMKNKMKG